MAKLNPPIIKSKLPAFYLDEYHRDIKIPFALDRAVSAKEFNSMSVIFRSVQSNIEKGKYTIPKNKIIYNYKSRNYELYCTPDFEPVVGQYYKVQIAFIDDITDPSDPVTGYYSDVGIIKCTSKPTVSIASLVTSEDNANRYSYTGEYSQIGGDTTEKVYSYIFNLYDSTGAVVATSGEQLHNSSYDEIGKSSDTWTVRKSLIPNVKYQIEYKVTTMNDLEPDSAIYPIVEIETLPPNVHASVIATPHPDDGYVTISLKGDNSKTYVNGSFVLLRSGSDENYDSWYELTKFYLSSWDARTTKEICEDHTITHGVQYKYAIQAYNSAGVRSDRLENLGGPITCDFEDAFLWDGERQLKIRFNPKVSSFKSTILESKMDTIGGKYPFVFRNGNVEYKEFPISGLLSLLTDENNLFKTGLYVENPGERRGTPAAANTPTIGISRTQLTAENMYAERQFKMDVLAWLTDGKPKLFRSPAEGNYIVRLMNTSLSPNDQLGRMLHTFSSTAYEIAECNFDNLQSYGFTTPAYTETRVMKIAQVALGTAEDPYWNTTDKTSYLPMAYFASIEGAPRTNFIYQLANSTEIHVGSTGVTGIFTFPSEVLEATPLVSISRVDSISGNPMDDWNGAKLTFGYYDAGIDAFSYIRDISITDRIVQMIGPGTYLNLIENLEDIRIKTGAFHYIRVAPREIKYVYNVNGILCWNNSGNRVDLDALNANTLYFIVNAGEPVSSATNYIDGRYPHAERDSISNISYDFSLDGAQKVDLTGASALTSGRFEAFTNLSSVINLRAGNGLLLDLVYQEKTILYEIELTNETVKGLKLAWQANPTEQTYKAYITALNNALQETEDEYNVEHAI